MTGSFELSSVANLSGRDMSASVPKNLSVSMDASRAVADASVTRHNDVVTIHLKLIATAAW